jgi:hypothetical protein
MMKRIFSAALFCAVALSLAAPAFAQSYAGIHSERTDYLTWRHQTYGGSGNTWESDLAERTVACPTCGHYDSTSVVLDFTLGQLDTTTWISTQDFVGWTGPSAAADTGAFFVLSLTSNSSLCDADSLFITTQGSYDGVTPITTNPWPIAVNLATATCGFQFVAGCATPAANTRLKTPFVRFIVGSTGGTTQIGAFRAKLGYWTSRTDL